MINRLLVLFVNYSSVLNYNKIFHSFNKPVRIRLSQLINAIRTELAVEEEIKLGNVNIYF